MNEPLNRSTGAEQTEGERTLQSIAGLGSYFPRQAVESTENSARQTEQPVGGLDGLDVSLPRNVDEDSSD